MTRSALDVATDLESHIKRGRVIPIWLAHEAEKTIRRLYDHNASQVMEILRLEMVNEVREVEMERARTERDEALKGRAA